MKNKPVKLTSNLLRSLIEEEFSKMDSVEDRAKDTKELDADEQADAAENVIDWKKVNHLDESDEADTLDEHIQYMKALKIEESRLTRRLSAIRRTLSTSAKKLVNSKIV